MTLRVIPLSTSNANALPDPPAAKGLAGFLNKARTSLLGPKVPGKVEKTFMLAGLLAGVSATAMVIGMVLGTAVVAATVATPIGWAALGVAAIGVLILVCVHMAKKHANQKTGVAEMGVDAFFAVGKGFLAIPAFAIVCGVAASALAIAPGILIGYGLVSIVGRAGGAFVEFLEKFNRGK